MVVRIVRIGPGEPSRPVPSWANNSTQDFIYPLPEQPTGYLVGVQTFVYEPVEGGAALTADVTDAAPAVDAAARSVSVPRSQPDTAAAGDSLARTSSRSRAAGDSAVAADGTAGLVTRGRTVGDAAPAVDTSVRSVMLSRASGDAAPAADQVGRVRASSRSSAESAAAVDGTAGAAVRSRTVGDMAAASDGSAGGVLLARAAADVAGGTDAAARARASSRSAAEAAGAVDVVVRSSGAGRSIGDTAGAGDAVGAAPADRSRASGDAAGAVDAALRGAGLARLPVDAAGGVDGVSRASTRARALSDTAGVSDQTAAQPTTARFAADTAPAADTAARVSQRARGMAESGGGTDSPARSSGRSRAVVEDRGVQMVGNGFGESGDNTNWTAFTYNASDNPAGAAGHFRYPSNTTGWFGHNAAFPVDMNRAYDLSAYFRQFTAGLSVTAYLAVNPYDKMGLAIGPQHTMYRVGTTTTLAAPLNPGDTVMQLVSAANWKQTAGAASHWRTIIFWDYVDPAGTAYPQHTYSRNVYLNAYADGAVNFTANTVTLSAPWAGPAKAAGTPVSNGGSGGSYLYTGLTGQVVPQTWTRYTSRLIGQHLQTGAAGSDPSAPSNRWPAGTASAKVGMLVTSQANLATSVIGFGAVSMLAQPGDSTARVVGAPRQVVEAAGAGDAAIRSLVQARPRTETAPAVDVAARGTTRNRMAGDSAPAVDTSSRTVNSRLYAALVDAAPAVDATAPRSSYARPPVDVAGASDVTARFLNRGRITVEAAGAADAAAGVSTVARVVFDAAGGVDVVVPEFVPSPYRDITVRRGPAVAWRVVPAGTRPGTMPGPPATRTVPVPVSAVVDRRAVVPAGVAAGDTVTGPHIGG